MADTEANNLDDLEDGEIESDAEQQQDEAAPEVAPAPETPANIPDEKPQEDTKKSDSKSDKKKSKDKHKKHDDQKSTFEKSKETVSVEDDFASNIEKAIRKELKKRDPNAPNENGDSGLEDADNKRKHKKRKKEKHDHTDKEIPRKKKRTDSAADDDMDDDELMCVRGASPVRRRRHSQESNHSPDDDSYPSDGSDRDFRDRRNRNFRPRGAIRDFRNDRMRSRYDRHRMDKQDPDGICSFYLQGKCYKGDDCIYSHEGRPMRKMELCKFYLMDCCAKRDKCLYLHSDFPCKFYHTGLTCDNPEDCKFAHGKPLNENFKMILLKHIESAPKEILGDFPRLSREQASVMVNKAQIRLKQQLNSGKSNTTDAKEPSNKSAKNDNKQSPQNEKPKKTRIRQSRWCDTPAVNTFPGNSGLSQADAMNILSIQNLNGVLNTKQISDLCEMGIDNLNKLSQLTVIQLNQLGITINQINEIQLNTMNIQKLGLINNDMPSSPVPFFNKPQKDFDMRLPNVTEIPPTIENKPEMLGQDVDMRFHASRANSRDEMKNNHNNDSSSSLDPRKKNSIDVDQYTKDALKFIANDKENESNANIKSPSRNNEISDKNQTDDKKDLDVDHRVLNYVRDATVAKVKLDDDDALVKSETDTDIRLASLPIKQQEMFIRIQQKNEERARRPTTDDEDDILQIDEKWYSSDEEQSDKPIVKEKSPTPNDDEKSNTMPQVMEPNTVLKNLGDLSKIDISAEVTKLLTSIKSSSNLETNMSKSDYLKSRDPRNAAKLSSENKEDEKKPTPKPDFVSIYDCAENSNTETGPKLDTDLRPTQDLDFRLPTFGDTDLRQTPGGSDVDLRLCLPLKPIPNHTPAKEIDGSINSHPPISYKVALIDIAKPNYTDIKNSISKSQAAGDPRLRIIFRLSVDEAPPVDTDKSKAPISVRSDPRKRVVENVDKNLSMKTSSLDLQIILQTSEWFKELSSNNKILVNQQLAAVTTNLKMFHQDKSVGKKFDLSDIKSNNVLCMIFGNLGVFLDEKGEFFRINNQENSSANVVSGNFNQKPDMFMGGMMDNMNNMVGGNVGNMAAMGSMNNFDPRFAPGDPRGAPGILGMPPNMPPNFDNMNYNGMPNYNSDFNNAYDDDGYGMNRDDYMDDNMDDDYYREQNNDYQNNYNRGGRRNNDRWNRNTSRGKGGNFEGGGRDRRGYTERSGWKNDRH